MTLPEIFLTNLSGDYSISSIIYALTETNYAFEKNFYANEIASANDLRAEDELKSFWDTFKEFLAETKEARLEICPDDFPIINLAAERYI